MIDFVDHNEDTIRRQLHRGLSTFLPSLREQDIQITAGTRGTEIRFGAQDGFLMQALSALLCQATRCTSNFSNNKIALHTDTRTLAHADWDFFNTLCPTIIKTSVLPALENAKDKSQSAEQARRAIFTGVKHLFPNLKPEQIYFTHSHQDTLFQSNPDITHINICSDPDLTSEQKSKLSHAFKAADTPQHNRFGHSNMFNQFIFGGTTEELAALNWKKFQAEAQNITPVKNAGMGGLL